MNVAAAPAATPLYPMPEGRVVPLRVALVCPPRAPAWLRTFQELARGHPWLELAVVADPAGSVPVVNGIPAGLRVFVALEQALHGRDPGLVTVEMPGEADQAQPLAARLASFQPDLVLLVGSSPELQVALRRQAPLGAWRLDAALLDPRHAGLPLLGPMLEGETATQVGLALAGEGTPAVVLASSWGRTRAPSFALQRGDAFRKVPPLLLRALHRVAADHAPVAALDGATLQLVSTTRGPLRATGPRALAATLRAAVRSVVRRHRRPRDWMLAVRREAMALDPDAPAIGRHEVLRAPRGWWADPCVVDHAGRMLVFVEEMSDPRGERAVIACVELAGGGARRLGVVLEEPGHLSYPQAFEWEGRWYMTVESNYARRVSLYQAEEFPMRWTHVRELVTDRVCVDPTLHHHEGHWYLFANVAESGNSRCDDLFLFVADRLDGPYRPHPVAPVVGDVRRARMAGRLFRHGGRLIRPAQDCAPSYGSAVVFNEILELGPTAYRERMLGRFAPDDARDFKGFHTYSVAGGVEVLDALGHARGDVRPWPAALTTHHGSPPAPASAGAAAGKVEARPGQPPA